MRWPTNDFPSAEFRKQRRRRFMKQTRGAFVVLFVGTLVGLPSVSRAQDAAQIEMGKKVYDTYCVICHGQNGDGKGLMGVIHRAQTNGVVVPTYPRDFTAGMFKFRSTGTGSLPTDDDLLKTVTNGIPRSGMPSHNDLSLAKRQAVIEYIKTFSQRWREMKPLKPIQFPDPPDYVGTEASIARGRQMYDDAGCVTCHGPTGRGDGEAAPDLEDNWGDKILPFDFTSGPLKGGTSSSDIYRTFVTGLDGTPMPSYEDVLDEQQRWDIVSYCVLLMKGEQVAQK